MVDVDEPSDDVWRHFRRQESTLIILNLLALAAVVLVHLAFWRILEPPSLSITLAIGLRFFEQALEFVWLQRSGPLPVPLVRVYSHASIWINVAFAFLVGLLAHGHDPHYSTLMVMPMIAAGFRLAPAGIAAAVVCGSGLTVFAVWQHYLSKPAERWPELFEAATMGLVYLIVAVVVHLLSRQIEQDRAALRHHLAELRETRDRLIAEEKLAAVGRLAAAMAHEIRNPVATIASSLTLAEEKQGTELGGEARRIAVEEAQRLARLTSDLLAYARTQTPEKSVVPLQTLTAYVSDSVQARAEQADIRVEAAAADDLAALLDPYQMERALVNLALNAIDATPPGGRVSLGAERRGEQAVALWVENSAGPIAAADAERLFEPFFTTRRHGTGLGLAIARSLVRAHGGDVSLARNEPGLVRFEIVLPRAWAAAEPS